MVPPRLHQSYGYLASEGKAALAQERFQSSIWSSRPRRNSAKKGVGK
jgi:hypothetical protein